jgi:GMP synthase (glutamine-hydrolysing)
MIAILDFGSQYTQLIARRIRGMHVYSEIYPYHTDLREVARHQDIEGIVLSGGPGTVYAKDAFHIDGAMLKELNVPVLGICYGMQLLSYLYEGKIIPSTEREYGFTHITVDTSSPLFKGIAEKEVVWMSHGDKVEKLPRGFGKIAFSENALAGMENREKNLYAVQFHPEVVHTQNGTKMLENFVLDICQAKPQWEMESFIEKTVKAVREKVGDKKVVLGLSGGVDSSVLAILLNKALGKNLVCVFVNNGLLRKDEAEEIQAVFTGKYDLNFHYVDASDRFLDALKGITDPEEKRRIIGKIFLDVFNSEIEGFDYLAQGTLYPDVIESVSVKGPSDTIKTHHNRVEGVLDLIREGRIIEPFQELFKDEVREIGKEMNVPDFIIQRHPFPGPGLAIRILGEVTKERLDLLREADAIIIEEIKRAGLYQRIWQAFGVLLPVNAVGVMGDKRTYESVLAVRMVESLDGMTADWARVPYEVLNSISTRIINEVGGINRVTYDISSKPPATIEWE